MEKIRNILIVVIIIGVIVGVTFVVKNENVETSSEVSENYTYKIEIDYDTEPLIIVSYYFYDDMVVKEHYSGGVLATGPSTSSEFTEYKYNSSTKVDDLLENVDSQIHGVSTKKSNKTKTLTSSDFFDLAAIEENIDAVINKFAVEK